MNVMNQPRDHGEARGAGKRIVHFLRRDDGPTAAEYAVMLSLILVATLVVFTFGKSMSQMWATNSSTITSGMGHGAG